MTSQNRSGPSQTLPEYLACRLHLARRNRHRCLAVFLGGHDWALAQARRCLDDLALKQALWVGAAEDAAYEHRTPGRAHTVLGQEYDAVVMDAYRGFDADDFGALSGVLRGGGLFMILAPDFLDWLRRMDATADKMLVAGFQAEQIHHRFIRRLTRLLLEDEEVTIVREHVTEQAELCVLPDEPWPTVAAPGGRFATPDQQQAVESITQICHSQGPSALVMIADRGRGKSSALGITAAELLNRGVGRIVLTAPRMRAVDAVFERARAELPGADYSSGVLHGPQGSLSFYAPDALLHDPVAADLLMVDEAAAIPGQLLQQLLAHYPRVVFATTVHGYEGSGRGFELRFARVLDRERPGWQRLRLDQPVRWSAHDPLEAFSYNALLMDARPVETSLLGDLHPEACRSKPIDRNVLIEDESLLRELFGLLVTAHYRTRPFDLRYLLDAPNVSIYVLRCQGHVVATAMLAEEGGFDDRTSLAIFAGLRRPRGHLLAQSLAAHVGVESAPQRRYLRVVRIAVHPELQGRGLGSALLDGIIADAVDTGMDGIGASFAADPDVMRFWRQRGFHAVHVGIGREHTSGSHPVMVLRPLSDVGQAIYDEARQRFASRLPVLLEDVLTGLDPELSRSLLDDLPTERRTPSGMHELLAFSYASRGFEISLYVIEPFIRDLMNRGLMSSLDSRKLRLLELRVLGHQDWKQVIEALALSGRREALELMRNTLAQIIDQRGDPVMLQYRDRLKQLDLGVHATSE